MRTTASWARSVGSKSREVLLTLEEWHARREAEEQAADEEEYEYEEVEEVDEGEESLPGSMKRTSTRRVSPMR